MPKRRSQTAANVNPPRERLKILAERRPRAVTEVADLTRLSRYLAGRHGSTAAHSAQVILRMTDEELKQLRADEAGARKQSGKNKPTTDHTDSTETPS